MTINEILSLKSNANSVKKIDDFLASSDLGEDEYFKVVMKLVTILNDLKDYKDIDKILNYYLNISDISHHFAIYKRLFTNYINLGDKKMARFCLDKKFELGYKDEAKYCFDLYRYYKLCADTSNQILSLNRTFLYDLKDNKRLNNYLLLSDIYLNNNDYFNFIDNNTKARSLALILKNKSIINESSYKEAYIDYLNGKYEEALEILNNLEKEEIDYNFNAKIKTLILNIYVSGLKEYRKASIFEAEVEDIVTKGELKTQMEFCSACVLLYKELGNQFNLTIYENKLNDLEYKFKEEENKANDSFSFDFKFLDLNKEIIKEEIVKEKEEKKVIKLDINKKNDSLINLNIILEELNKYDLSLNEFIRQSLILLNKIVKFKEIYLYVLGNQYHYKKERLYQKQNDLSDTIVGYCFFRNEDLIINGDAKNFKSVLSQEYFTEDQNIASISMKNGVMAANFNNEIKEESTEFYTLKLFTNYLDIKLNCSKEIVDFNKRNEGINKFFDSASLGIRRGQDRYVSLSKNLANLLHLDTNIMIDEYVSKIDNNYVMRYHEVMNNLKDNSSVIYKFKDYDFYVKETFVLVDDYSFSVLVKYSDDLNYIEKNKIDPITKLKTKQYLLDYILDESKKNYNFSIGLIVPSNIKFYEEIYGYDFSYEINKAIGIYLKKLENESLSFYLIESFKYVLIMNDVVDKRQVNNKLNSIITYLKNELHNLNSRINLEINSSFIRLNEAKDENLDSIIELLYFSLDKDEVVSCFDKKKYRTRMFEASLTTHISESIDQNELKLNYRQVVNYETKNIKYLFIELNLSNYDTLEEKIYEVAIKRGIKDSILKYLIHRGLFEASEIKDKKKYYLGFIYRIDSSLLNDLNFINYLIEQAKFFNVPLEIINLYYEGLVSDEVISSLNNLIKLGFNIITNNLELLKNLKLKAFIYNNFNGEDYFISSLSEFCLKNKIDLIINNIESEKDIAKYSILGIKYYMGKLYNRLLDLKTLIK